MPPLRIDGTLNNKPKTKNNVIHFDNVKLQFGSEQIYDNISFDVNDVYFIENHYLIIPSL